MRRNGAADGGGVTGDGAAGEPFRFRDFLRARLDALQVEIEAEVSKHGIGMGDMASLSPSERLITTASKVSFMTQVSPRNPERAICGDGDNSFGLGRCFTIDPPISPKPRQSRVLKSFKAPSIQEMELSLVEAAPVGSRAKVYAGGIELGNRGALGSVLFTASTSSRNLSFDKLSFSHAFDKWGEWAISLVTLANSVTIGLSVDVWPTWMGWTYIDTFFAFAFLLHMLMVMFRLGVAEYMLGSSRRCNILSDIELRWRWFELFLVFSAFAEVAFTLARNAMLVDGLPPISIFRLLRLTRIARLLRFAKLRIFTELSMMINGAIGGMRTLLWSILMIALPLYAFSLFMHEALDSQTKVDGPDIDLFDSIPMAFFTTFRCAIGGDCSTPDGRPVFLLISQHYGFGYAFLYCFMLIVMVFGIFNVIAAIFVENTLAGAKRIHLSEKHARLCDTRLFAEKIVALVKYVAKQHAAFNATDKSRSDAAPIESPSLKANDSNDSKANSFDLQTAMHIQITSDFLVYMCQDDEFQGLLRALDICEEDQMDLFETLDVDGNGTIDLEELVIGLRKLRGSMQKSDIVGAALIVRSTQLRLNDFMEQTESSMDHMRGMIAALLGPSPLARGRSETTLPHELSANPSTDEVSSRSRQRAPWITSVA